MALFLGGMVNVVLHFVSARAFFLGVLENSAAFELEGFDEFEKLLVVGLSFAGEACDKGGTNREIWNAPCACVEEGLGRKFHPSYGSS